MRFPAEILPCFGTLTKGVSYLALLIGWPPYALAYQHSPSPELRSTLLFTAAMLAFLTIGSFLSGYVHRRLDGLVLCCIVLGFAIASGAIVIIQS